jgi:hypothetical protein
MATDPSVTSAQRRYDDTARPRYGASAPAPYLLRKPDELAGFFDGLDWWSPAWCRARAGGRTGAARTARTAWPRVAG